MHDQLIRPLSLLQLDACEQAYKMHLYRTMLQVVLDRYYAEDLKVRGRDVAVGTIRKSMVWCCGGRALFLPPLPLVFHSFQ